MTQPPAFIFAFVVAVVLSLAPSPSLAIDHSHAQFTDVLAGHVSDGLVNYQKLAKDPGKLGSYLESLTRVSRQEFDRWSKPQKIAFLVNLYNAQTLKLVKDHYPVGSIKDIGGFRGPFKLKIIRLWGSLMSLDDVEHGILRAEFHEPRIHFALVCAARSCPNLRSEAYQAARLGLQFDDQLQSFLRDESKNQIFKGKDVIYLSQIFDWFEDDFAAASGSVTNFLIPYLPPEKVAAARSGKLRVKYVKYDWSLNDLP
jgi:hypothetical protein